MSFSTSDALRTALAQLDAGRVATDADSLERFGRDWSRQFAPAPLAIVFPRSTAEVQKIVRWARSARVGLVPSGGRTGLSGGATASNGEVVVALDAMNAILDYDAPDRSVRCQPGVVTRVLQDYANERGLFYPVDFASAGSSTIGGNIATNAGGIKVIRYGMTREWITGLTVVTGAGEVLELNHGLLKNATGYDLRHLFIGSEGTLGIVTEATVRLARAPQNLTVMVLGLDTFAAIMQVMQAFRARLDLTAFEFFSDKALAHVCAHTGLPAPFDTPAAYYALIEFDAENDLQTEAAMAVFEDCMEQGWVSDGVISQSEQQRQSLWRLREDISETLSSHTPYKNDLSVKISAVPDFLHDIDEIGAREYPDFEIVWFGHIGDGNLHLNILKPAGLAREDFFERCKQVNQHVFETVRRYRGSISAEHGVGLVKRDYLEYSRSPAEITAMKGLKAVFDPDGIMNPGKIFH